MIPTSSNNPNDSKNEALRNFSKAKPLAARVGIHPKTIFRWSSAGKISRYKVNERIVLFDPDEVLRFIQNARVG